MLCAECIRSSMKQRYVYRENERERERERGGGDSQGPHTVVAFMSHFRAERSSKFISHGRCIYPRALAHVHQRALIRASRECRARDFGSPDYGLPCGGKAKKHFAHREKNTLCLYHLRESATLKYDARRLIDSAHWRMCRVPPLLNQQTDERMRIPACSGISASIFS